MTIILAIFLGIIQGITEFLPISSSGHLSIFQNLLKVGEGTEGHLFFDVLLHLGTLISICVFYWKDLRAIGSDVVAMIRGDKNDEWVSGSPVKAPVRLLVMIIIGTLPLLLILPFKSRVETLFYKTWFIGLALIVTGAILFVTDRYISSGRKNEKTMTVKDALIIGLSQMIAVIPGLSRSGTTISVGQALGLNRDFAVRFSLLLSLPAVLGSTIVTLISSFKEKIDWSLMPAYLIGFVLAAVVGYFAIGLLKRIVNRGHFGKFAYYCWGAGAVAILLTIIL